MYTNDWNDSYRQNGNAGGMGRQGGMMYSNDPYSPYEAYTNE